MIIARQFFLLDSGRKERRFRSRKYRHVTRGRRFESITYGNLLSDPITPPNSIEKLRKLINATNIKKIYMFYCLSIAFIVYALFYNFIYRIPALRRWAEDLFQGMGRGKGISFSGNPKRKNILEIYRRTETTNLIRGRINGHLLETSGRYQHIFDAEFHFKEVLSVGNAERSCEVGQLFFGTLSEYSSLVFDVGAVPVFGDASLSHWNDAFDKAFHLFIADPLRQRLYARSRSRYDALQHSDSYIFPLCPPRFRVVSLSLVRRSLCGRYPLVHETCLFTYRNS